MRVLNGHLRVAASDLSNFLACRHLTRLDAGVANGLLKKPFLRDIGFEQLAQRGRDHEARVLDGFRANGWVVREIPVDESDDERVRATTDALEDGVNVVYQGALRDGDRFGLPDFLIRADLIREGEPHNSDRYAGYEVVDAKLARSAKARAVLQTVLYSELLTKLLGKPPEFMHLALGGADGFESFRFAEYGAYGRQVDAMLSEFLAEDTGQLPPPDTYPEPTEHCSICRWRVECMKRRRDDDDLSLVANISSRQRKALKDERIATLEAFAEQDPLPDLPRVGRPGLEKAQRQARLQLERRRTDEYVWELLEPERDDDGNLVPDRGLLALPEPNANDLFFDIEGARYYSEDGKEFGLQYLFGVVDGADLDEQQRPRYHQFWAFDRVGEKDAFEQLIDFFEERLRANPDLHIYHYNHYEPTSMDHLADLHETREVIVGRLMGRFGTKEDEVDDLLRRRIFVDLYRVVRQGLLASVESYSIKKLEPLCGYERAVDLQDVNERMVLFDGDLEAATARDDVEAQRLIAGYNEDDCRATLALRDWLEERREELEERLGESVPRPEPGEADPNAGTDPAIERLRDDLLAGLPEDPTIWTPEQRSRELVANLLEWHRREDKPKWWRWFYLLRLDDEELLGERDALSGLVYEGIVDEVKQSNIHRLSFPPQEHPFSEGGSGVDRDGRPWPIWAIDERAGTVDLKLGKKSEHPLPTVLIQHNILQTNEHRARLFELGERVVALGEDTWPHEPDLDLLLRRPPNVRSGAPLRSDDEAVTDAGVRLAVELEGSVLPIQGPPGSGKTYLGARQILALVGAGKKVGVTAVSHKVISNLLDRVAQLADEQGITVRLGQKPSDEADASTAAETYKDNAAPIAAIRDGEIDVLGATTWLWAREDARDLVDVLLVDEAGQMSLANTLAAANGCRNLILLGDPLQLAQPSQAAHPPGAGVCALEQVLGDAVTMPDRQGLFVDRTRRLHPDICRYTSEVFYEDRLDPLPGLEHQVVLPEGPFEGTGLRLVPVPHEGNSNSSDEEAAEVARIVVGTIGGRWVDAHGVERPIGSDEVMVVTPFNAQVRAIQEALAAAGFDDVEVGTVDRFQGQEAPVTIYSMASSSAEESPRGMEFLLDQHRLNVATSRARCLSIIVASPDLLRAFCRTPHQMDLVSALCRFAELARP